MVRANVTPKISVIIPVFNVGKYLRQCILSLVNQTLTDIELIFVNDGSTDESGIILNEFKKRDDRIKVIEQENQGVSVARNKGLDIAKGDFIGFVDGDDFVEKDFFAKLFSVACESNVDILISNFITYQDGKKIVAESKFEVDRKYNEDFIQDEIIPFFIKEDSLNSCCTKLFSSELAKKQQFPVGITNGEDGLYNMACFNNATNIRFINYAGYHYREVEGSASRNVFEKDYLKIALDVYHFNYSDELLMHIDSDLVEELRSIRLVNNLMALINMIFRSRERGVDKLRRVNRIVRQQELIRSLDKYWNKIIIGKGRFDLFILYSMRIKFVFLLYLAIRYSHFRNKI